MIDNTPQLTPLQKQILGALTEKSKFLIWIGVAFITLGSIGLFAQVAFSFAAIGLISTFAIICGLIQGWHASTAHGWKSIFVQAAFSTLYLFIGIYAWIYPASAIQALAFWLGVFFLLTGCMRLILAFQHKAFKEWLMPLLSAILSLALGVMILNGWPSDSLWVPGLLFAIELVLQGWTLLFIGRAAQRTAAARK